MTEKPLDILTNRVNAAIANLRAGARTTNEAREFRNFGREMNKRLIARHKHLTAHLAQAAQTIPKPVAIDVNGSLSLTDWKPTEANENFSLDKPMFHGRPTMHARVIKGDTIASFRTSLHLDEGLYQLQALAYITNVTALTNDVKRANGVGLRVSQEVCSRHILGSAGWTPLRYEFEVTTPGERKELICELRARSGEVWFDSTSLKLTRLK